MESQIVGLSTESIAQDKLAVPPSSPSPPLESVSKGISRIITNIRLQWLSLQDVEELSTTLVDTHSIDPCLNGITLPPSFQPLPPEQPEYQQLQPNLQQHDLHSHQGTIAKGECETVYADDAPTLVHMSMPTDDALDSETVEMDVVNQELAEFRQFSLMVQPLKNHPKVHLHGLQLDLRKTYSHLKSSAPGYAVQLTRIVMRQVMKFLTPH